MHKHNLNININNPVKGTAYTYVIKLTLILKNGVAWLDYIPRVNVNTFELKDYGVISGNSVTHSVDQAGTWNGSISESLLWTWNEGLTKGVNFLGYSGLHAGSISGSVKNDNGTLLIANADVRIYNYNPLITGQWVDCGGAKTDSNGNYTILGVKTGVYGVRAIAVGYANVFFNGIYDYRQANPVSVTAPDNVSNIDFTLEIGGSISGRVVSQSTGQPLANVSVDCGTDAIPPCWGATTDQNGNYIITSLSPGQYKVRSPIGWGSGDGNYVMKYYDDKTNWKEADLVTISTGSLDITGIKLSLESSNVNISVILQGGGRPDAGWAVPLTLKFFDNSTGVPGAILYTFVENTTKSGSTAVAIVGGIPSGTYDISVVSPHCLTNKKAGVVIATPSTAVNLGTLLEGDSNSTALSANTINIADFGILASAYGKNAGEDGYDAQADFDRNGIVNIADFGLLAANYGKNAPVEVP